MIINVICYKVKSPVVYNKGTKWESSCDTFLACYGGTQDMVNRLNTDINAKEQFCAEHRLDADNIDYFFINQQEEFDTRGD